MDENDMRRAEKIAEQLARAKRERERDERERLERQRRENEKK